MGSNVSKCANVKQIHQNERNIEKIVLSKEEWKDIRKEGPGVRMYKGLQTLFYNGEKLWEGDFYSGIPIVYDRKERETWQQVIVLPGVKTIPMLTFKCCKNIKRVIMADTVMRVEKAAFAYCTKLMSVSLSRNLQYIGEGAFICCNLYSIFIPETCGVIGNDAFLGCNHLLIFSISQSTRLLGNDTIRYTALMRRSPFDSNDLGKYDNQWGELNSWARNINHSELYSLHRICSSFHPSMAAIQTHLNKFGLESLDVQNAIGISPSHYLAENPSLATTKKVLINRYINAQSINSIDGSHCEQERINRYIMKQMG